MAQLHDRTIGGIVAALRSIRKTKHRGIAAIGGDFMLSLIAYNLVRIPKLMPPEHGLRLGHAFNPQKSLSLLDRSSNRPQIHSTKRLFSKLLERMPHSRYRRNQHGQQRSQRRHRLDVEN